MTVSDSATPYMRNASALARYYSQQYNARASISNYQNIFARWARESAHVRATNLGLFDLPYGDAAGERLDFFPAAQPGGALLVFIHGGWWRSLDKSDFSFIAPAFTQAGVNVALTNYTLAPAATIEEITLQQVRALAWLYRQCARFAADPRRIVVAGHSAGAHLAAMMMAAVFPACAADLPLDLVKGGFIFSGLYDLAPVRHAAFVNCDLKLTPERIGPLSPVTMAQSHPTRFFTATGSLESDEFKRQNALISVAWAKCHAGDIPVPLANHLTICEAMAAPGRPLFDACIRLIAEVGAQNPR